MTWTLSGGDVPDPAVSGGVIAMSGDRIVTDREPATRTFDATGLIVAPGICDVHGDGFERNLAPRPGVTLPIETALLETDRQLLSNGITTAWLAMTVSWEPGLRSQEMAVQILDASRRMRPYLKTDMRFQLRWETFALDAVDALEKWIAMEPKPVLAINDHLTGMLKGDRIRQKLDQYAGKAGISTDAYLALVDRTASRKDEIPAAIARLVSAARRHDVVVFAHDETNASTRRMNRMDGVTVSEFPLSAEAAREAVEHDEPTILGAPNVLRGGSHIGALNAADAVADGLCSVLASDYYYPSQLQAVARLEREKRLSFEEAWPLISRNAARAAGLDDRGTLAPGMRADVIALERVEGGFAVIASFVAGNLVWTSDPTRISG